MSEALAQRLNEISKISSQKDKTAEYRAALDICLANTNQNALANDLETFVDYIVQEHVGLVISRQVLSDFVQGVDKIDDLGIKRRVLHFALNKIQPRIVSFEEQVRTWVSRSFTIAAYPRANAIVITCAYPIDIHFT